MVEIMLFYDSGNKFSPSQEEKECVWSFFQISWQRNAKKKKKIDMQNLRKKERAREREGGNKSIFDLLLPSSAKILIL